MIIFKLYVNFVPISHWRMTVAYVSRDFKGAVPSGDNFEPFFLSKPHIFFIFHKNS